PRPQVRPDPPEGLLPRGLGILGRADRAPRARAPGRPDARRARRGRPGLDRRDARPSPAPPAQEGRAPQPGARSCPGPPGHDPAPRPAVRATAARLPDDSPTAPACALDRRPPQPPDGACVRQPALAAPLRPGPGPLARQLRLQRPEADPPRAPRL